VDSHVERQTFRDFLLRAGVVAVVVAGLVTVLVVVRLVFSSPAPNPTGVVHPVALEETEAVDRWAAALDLSLLHPRSTANSDPEEWERLQHHLDESFPRAHRTLDVERVDAVSLLYTWEGSDPALAPILLAAHQGMLQDGAGDGQGRLGMRTVMLSILEGVESLLAEGFEPHRTVLLAFSGDGGAWGGGRAGESSPEEDRGGIPETLIRRGIHPSWVLTGGGGLMTGLVPGVVDPVALVGVAERGIVEIELTLRAGEDTPAPMAAGETPVQAGESEGLDSRPRRRYGPVGDLAARRAAGDGSRGSAAPLIQAIARLEEPFDPRIEGPGRELLETMAPHMDPGTRMLIRNLWIFRRPVARALAEEPGSRELVRTTSIPLLIRAGRDEGAPPDPAMARVRLQLAPWESVEGVLESVRNRLRDLEVDVAVRQVSGGPVRPDPPVSPGTAEAFRGEGFDRIREAVHQTFPDVVAVTPGVALFPTEGRRYHEVADQVYRFAPFRVRVPVSEGALQEVIPSPHYLAMVRFYSGLIRGSSGPVDPIPDQ
jgi:carboxypeptidase PM20D1